MGGYYNYRGGYAGEEVPSLQRCQGLVVFLVFFIFILLLTSRHPLPTPLFEEYPCGRGGGGMDGFEESNEFDDDSLVGGGGGIDCNIGGSNLLPRPCTRTLIVHWIHEAPLCGHHPCLNLTGGRKC